MPNELNKAVRGFLISFISLSIIVILFNAGVLLQGSFFHLEIFVIPFFVSLVLATVIYIKLLMDRKESQYAEYIPYLVLSFGVILQLLGIWSMRRCFKPIADNCWEMLMPILIFIFVFIPCLFAFSSLKKKT